MSKRRNITSSDSSMSCSMSSTLHKVITFSSSSFKIIFLSLRTEQIVSARLSMLGGGGGGAGASKKCVCVGGGGCIYTNCP